MLKDNKITHFHCILMVSKSQSGIINIKSGQWICGPHHKAKLYYMKEDLSLEALSSLILLN